jgi:hypothetical protein
MTPSLATLRCDEKEGMKLMRNVGSDAQAIAVSVIDQNEPGPGNLVAAINIGGGTYTAVESGISRSLATSKK